MSSLLFVADATPTDQSPFAIRHSLPFTLYALRFTTYQTLEVTVYDSRTSNPS